jgi:hypothetical protein
LVIIGCGQGDSSASGPWETFLASPSSESEQLLLANIGENLEGCGWGKAENQDAIPDRFRQDLFNLIAKGDLPAYRVGLQIEKCLDGGDLGDFRRSTGLFFDTNPDAFLEESIREGVPPERLAYLIASLPLYLVDDPISQRNLVIERIGKLEHSKIAENSQTTGDALNALREREQLLSDAIKD